MYASRGYNLLCCPGIPFNHMYARLCARSHNLIEPMKEGLIICYHVSSVNHIPSCKFIS
jgi:hypothetical protein